MSLNDADHWASQVINDLVDEIAASGRNAEISVEAKGSLWHRCDADRNLTHLESNDGISLEFPPDDGVSSRGGYLDVDSRTYKDYITESPCHSEEGPRVSGVTNGVSNRYDELSDIIFETDQGFKEPEENTLCIPAVRELNLMNVKDCIKTIEKEVKNLTRESEVEGKPTEVSIARASDSRLVNTEELSLNKDNSSDHGEVFVTDIAQGNNTQSKDGDCSGKKDEENLLFLTEDLETEATSSIENYKELDEKVRSLGFRSLQNSDDEPERSSSLTDLYYNFFTENYIKEEMDYRWRADTGSFQMNSWNVGTTDDIPQNLQPEVLKKHDSVDFKPALIDNNNDTPKEAVENTVDNRKNEIINQERGIFRNGFTPFKRKNRNTLEEIDVNFENLYSEYGQGSFECNMNSIHPYFNSKLENNNFCPMLDENVEKISDRDDTLNYAQGRNNYISPKDNFSSNFLRRKRRKLDHEEEEDLVITKRVDKIITIYQNACRVFEELVVRPSAMIIAESLEFFIYLFFLSICVLYIFYKGATSSFVKMSRHSFTDLFKRGNQTIKSNISELLLSRNISGSRNGVNEEPRRKQTSLVRFSSGHANDTSENEIQLSVAPEDVLVLNSVFEHVKQNLEDMYEKGGDFLESLNREHQTAAIMSSDDDFVDIVLKECAKFIQDPSSGNDLDMEVIASSKATCYKEYGSNESVANKFCNSSRALLKTYCGGRISHCSKKLAKTSSNESLLKDFSIVSDREKGYILNSTEVDESEIDTRANSRNRSNFIGLSPSEKDVWGSVSVIACSSPAASQRKISCSSSMNVNVPSFRSRSQLNLYSNSLSSLNSQEKASGSIFYLKGEKKDMSSEAPDMMDHQDATASVNLKRPREATELMHSRTPDGKREISCVMKPAELHYVGFKENFMANTSEEFPNDYHPGSEFSDTSSNHAGTDSGNPHVCTLQCENSYSFNNPGFLCDLSTVNTSSNESDSLMGIERGGLCDDRIPKERKNNVNLRRRISLMLSDWKNRGMMQCVASNLKSRKKYKKQLNTI